MTDQKPALRPACANFSSGPCAKIPGWTPDKLKHAVVGRSHRSSLGKARLKKAIELTREVLEVPADYKIGIVPASDTGAVEMALWSLLGQRPVDMVAWESFGDGWVSDVLKQLKLKDARKITAGYGDLPDLKQIDFSHDVVFTWNGTTSGVRVPDANWIPANREGLTICDATSSAFAQEMDFTKLDVVTFSWQKVLGGEGAHGVLILSPRAVERLESYVPAWPLPKIFRLTSGGKLIAGIFEGETINTPSMLCVEDYIVSLEWAKDIGGLKALRYRADANASVIDAWVSRNKFAHHLAKVAEHALQHIRVPDARWRRRCVKENGEAAGSRRCRLRHRRLPRCPSGPAHLVRRHRRNQGSRSFDALARLGLRQRHRSLISFLLT